MKSLSTFAFCRRHGHGARLHRRFSPIWAMAWDVWGAWARGRNVPSAGLAAVDADKDGKITEAELTAFRAAETKAADADGDGLLSAEELAALHVKAMTARATDMAARMVSRMDSDADGKLSARGTGRAARSGF